MKEYIHHRNFLLIVFILQCFAAAELKDEKNRQTFVIRYKNGDQTIPVTVVLDYKKQTEYVINMNPRTPAKSVTLYDFKQRTIAYKDLTNRECFLGRLTHETMNHESAALHEVKNPVDSKPKILSLDPHKPALTPTEIRNIAGQKTAVFCRKMNTWLLQPLATHKIKKRDVDDEFEERTYNRHGYHTVQYAHYGRETRRRYRNPSRINSRNRTQIYQIPAENKNPRHSPEIPSETFNFDEIPHQPVSNNHYHAGSYDTAPQKENIHVIPQTDHHTDKIPRGFGDSALAHHFNFQMPEERNKANNHNGLPEAKDGAFSNQPVRISDRTISNSAVDSEGNVFTSVYPTASDLHSGYHVRSPHNFRDNYSSSFPKSTKGNLQDNSQHSTPNFNYGRSSVNNEIHNDVKETFPAGSENVNNFLKTSLGDNAGIVSSYPNSVPNKMENIVSTNHDKNISDIPLVPYQESRGEYLRNLYSEFENFSPTFKPETENLKLHKSHLSSHVKIDERNPNEKLYRQSITRNRNIETEALAEEKLHNISSYSSQIINPVEDIRSTTEDPDVSINVLEIPKISNKFENLNNRAKPNIPGQNNEDVHKVLEGFYDLHSNYPSSRPNQNVNSSIHQVLNGEKRQQFLIPNSHTFTKRISSRVGGYDNLKNKSNVSYPHTMKLTTPGEGILYTTSSPEHERIINAQLNYFNKINDSTTTFYKNPSNYNYLEANNAIQPDTTKFTALAEEFPYTTSSPEHKRIINAQSNYINEVKNLNATAFNNPNNQDTFQTFSHSIRNSPNKQNAFSSNVISSNQFSFSNTLDEDRISEPNALDIIPKPYAITVRPTILKSVSISNHRSDLPSENILDENIDNNASSNFEITKHNIFSKPGINNTNTYNLPTDIIPNLITEDETSPRRIRFQNVLRDFKPDKIIIDVEKISTEQPPGSTSDFRRRTKTNESPINRSFNNVIKARDKQSEQSEGATFRSHPIYITRGPRLRGNHGMQKQTHNGVTFHVRKDVFPLQQQPNNSHLQGHPRLIYNRNEIPLQNQIVSAHQFNHPHQYDHQLQMNALPPGVSMHPRHPQAPYANMLHTNMIQSLPQSNPELRPHRQRHHRKKDRFTNSCCRISESSNIRQSCCRSGGSCCSGLRRTLLPRTSCCSSKNNHNKQVRFPSRNQKQVQNDQPQPQVTGKLLDTRDRCQKEKMCRTVYESTQQVMVCRNVNIAGC